MDNWTLLGMYYLYQKNRIKKLEDQRNISLAKDIVNDWIIQINKQSNKIYKVITNIYSSNSKDEYETMILNNDIDNDFLKIAFWVEYQLELFPINWDLEEIWSFVAFAFRNKNVQLNTFYHIEIQRYFLAITCNHPNDKNSIITNVIYNHHNKGLMKKIIKGIQWVIKKNKNIFRNVDFENRCNEEVNAIIKLLTFQLLQKLKYKTEPSCFINRLGYVDHCSFYEFDEAKKRKQ